MCLHLSRVLHDELQETIIQREDISYPTLDICVRLTELREFIWSFDGTHRLPHLDRAQKKRPVDIGNDWMRIISLISRMEYSCCFSLWISDEIRERESSFFCWQWINLSLSPFHNDESNGNQTPPQSLKIIFESRISMHWFIVWFSYFFTSHQYAQLHWSQNKNSSTNH